MYKRSAKIKNDKGEYVRAKPQLKVLQGNKSKVYIQNSEKAVVTQANIKLKQLYPLHIPYRIPFIPDQVEPNANEDQERVNSKDGSSISENFNSTLPYVLFSSSELSDLDEKPKLRKDNQDYQLDYKITK